MRLCIGIAAAAGLLAQDPPPTAPVRGTLLEYDDALSGQFTIRDPIHRVHCFRFDAGTRIERQGQRISISMLKPGDTLDVVPGQEVKPGQPNAKSVAVVAARPEPPSRRIRLYRRRDRLPADELFPRGHLTFSGLVSQVNPERLVLRMRGQNEARILIRPDTRFLREGSQVAASALDVNTHVFVRAGKNLQGDIEAFQVIWGRIVNPRQ